jgi:peptidoglycan hydrolase-like protein with peptidoglycan-binding domain
MTPFRLRLLVTAFLAIATAITVNALYFQAPPQLAVTAQGSAVQKKPAEAPVSAPARPRAMTTAALPTDAAPPRAAPPAPPLTDKTAGPEPTPLVRSIQKKLIQFGYKSLPQDGLPGRETRAAILAAQFEQGVPMTGEPADSVLAALFFLEASGRTRIGSSERFEQDRRLVEQVEDFLAKLGYGSGPIDGQLDGKTREAIRRFEADRQLKADGRLTERILLEMTIENGKPLLAGG